MASNSVMTRIDETRALMAFYNSLSDEAKAVLPAFADTAWEEKVRQAMQIAASGDGETATKTRKEAEAVHYSVLVLYTDGTFEVVGSAFAARGRGDNDLTKLEAAAAKRVVLSEVSSDGARTGSVIRLRSSDLGTILHTESAAAE